MFRTAARRTCTAIVAVMVLLFSQMVLAGYLCPTGSVQEQPAMEMAPGEPCEGMGADPGQPVLCYQHCTNAPQSADGLKVPSVSLPAVVQVLLVPVKIDSAHQVGFLANALEAQPPPDPLFLSTLRLRV
jgi:hypothetical protein